MRVMNLPRGGGKTTRAVLASEQYKYPVLVTDKTRAKIIKDKAKELNAEIPDPISINDLRFCDTGVIVDEGIHILTTLIQDKADCLIEIPLITLSVSGFDVNNILDVAINRLGYVEQDVQRLNKSTISELTEKCNDISNSIARIRKDLEGLRMV